MNSETADPSPDATSKSATAWRDAMAVVQRLRSDGHVAYFAGGCVRDRLLGLPPKDIDVATDAMPDRVRQIFPRTQAVGAAFGVILVREGRSQIEVATFRTDGHYSDGRRPDGVEFTTAEQDAKRRDFTINGMFLDPIDGRVIDFVGGQRDLQNKLLRAIGNPDARFSEDHLRILRALRFAARFGLKIERQTADAIAAHRDQLRRISGERVADELRRMLTPPTRNAAWAHLVQFELLPVLFHSLPGVPQTANHLPPLLFCELAPSEQIPFGLALAALALGYRGQPESVRAKLFEPSEVRQTVDACRSAFKISNDEAEMIAGCTGFSPLFQTSPPTVATLKRFLAGPFASHARRLLEAIRRAWPEFADRIDWLSEQFNRFPPDEIAPTPFVTGVDLTAAGLRPGRAFKGALDAAYDAQLEGKAATKAEALAIAVQLAGG